MNTPAELAPVAPTLHTERLVLRPFAEGDLDAYAEMNADAEVMRHIGAGGPVGRDIAWRQMALFAGHWALRGYGMWAVEEKASGRLVGRAGFLNPEGWPANELGWLLARPHWGRGFAYEAAAAARRHGRVAMGLSGRLISLIRAENQRSLALARRLGARLEETIEFMGATAQVWRHPEHED
ncbi:MAG: GNAT family N-acetyltransferase [Rubrivivax sp.]|nr:GNAT family N-acetyltransferase [Rubrivivax sp.]